LNRVVTSGWFWRAWLPTVIGGSGRDIVHRHKRPRYARHDKKPPGQPADAGSIIHPCNKAPSQSRPAASKSCNYYLEISDPSPYQEHFFFPPTTHNAGPHTRRTHTHTHSDYSSVKVLAQPRHTAPPFRPPLTTHTTAHSATRTDAHERARIRSRIYGLTNKAVDCNLIAPGR
jgi:hypothetical protein